MKFNATLLPATLVKRYKRFLADLRLPTGEIITAHCPNSGSMKGLNEPGQKVWYSKREKPGASLGYTLEFVECHGVKVGINTQYPNKLFKEGLEKGQICELEGCVLKKHEVRVGDNSRLDFLLEDGGGKLLYVEAKNVTLREGDTAYFPDAVTSRGSRHLLELIKLRQQGFEAVMFYVIQRGDCQSFSLERGIDPVYFNTFMKALDAGVRVYAYACRITDTEILLNARLPLVLEGRLFE